MLDKLHVVLLVVAARVTRQRVWLALPFAAFGTLALLGAIVGTHRHSYGVAALLFIQAVVHWRVFLQPVSVDRQP